jgi:hypothetical protein
VYLDGAIENGAANALSFGDTGVFAVAAHDNAGSGDLTRVSANRPVKDRRSLA